MSEKDNVDWRRQSHLGEQAARPDLAKPRPKKVFAKAEPGERAGRHVLLLDGRPAMTPAGRSLWLPNAETASAIAEEWDAQDETVDVNRMPLTRLVHSALDGVLDSIAAVRADIVKYAASDLLCYRAEHPQSLVDIEANAWDPILNWARAELGVALETTAGVAFVAQPAAALAAIAAAVARIEAPCGLTALHLMTVLSGSAVLALAVALGRLDPQSAWRAAHADEDFQMMEWGADQAAVERRQRRWRDFESAARLTRLVGSPRQTDSSERRGRRDV